MHGDGNMDLIIEGEQEECEDDQEELEQLEEEIVRFHINLPLLFMQVSKSSANVFLLFI